MKYTVSTLKNGLRVITSTNPQIETASVGIWVKTGSSCEEESVGGISHFLEHMVFKGTQTRSATDISEQMENVGGHLNAYTSKEFTAFYAKILKNDVELAIDILSDLITNPAFVSAEVEKEKEVVIQEIKQTLDDPADIIFDYFNEKAFPSQPLGRSILGPESHIKKFSAQTLRNYMSTNYAAENMVVCAVGNLEHKDFVQMVEQRLSNLQPQTKFKAAEQKYAGGFFKEVRKIEQAHMVLGFEGIAYSDENYYAKMVLNTIFGGGLSSRLFQEIREKRGLVYTVYSYTNFHTSTGLLGIYAGCSGDKLKELMPVVGTEINKICQEKASQTELERAKVQLKANMLMSLESTSSSSEILARQLLLFKRVLPIEELVERIESVNLDKVQNMAQKIFASNPNYALLGDVSDHPSYEEVKGYVNPSRRA